MTEALPWGDWPDRDMMTTAREALYTERTATAFAADFDKGSKRRAACDECRQRKLKCSGDLCGCGRCTKQNLICHYSHQKTMGRPRKKAKVGEDERRPASSILDQPTHFPAVENSLTTSDAVIHAVDRYATNCPRVWANYVQTQKRVQQAQDSTGDTLFDIPGNYGLCHDSSVSPPCDCPPTSPIPYPTSIATWPDYSTMAALPQPVLDNHKPTYHSAPFPSLDTLPSTPACPCLPSLYLTLSTLSTIAAFPVSTHTVESLHTATRTAQIVLYCRVCPTKFQSGLQNVMLLGTLLQVLADGWNRIRLVSPRNSAQDVNEGLAWRRFAHAVVRCNVFGDSATPLPTVLPDGTLSQSTCSFSCPKGVPVTLSFLIEGMQRRQKVWHGQVANEGDEFAPAIRSVEIQAVLNRIGHEEGAKETQYLCLKIAEGAPRVLLGLVADWQEEGI